MPFRRTSKTARNADLCAVVDELVAAEEVRGAAEQVRKPPEKLSLADADQEDGDRQGERDGRPHDDARVDLVSL